MDEHVSLHNSFNSKEDCCTQKCLFPIISTIALGQDALLVGISSVLGNYWTGALSIYKWDKQSASVFGGPCETTEHGVVENLAPKFHSFASFEASVAAITVLQKGSGPTESDASIVGLDDGSLQLITMPMTVNSYAKQSLTIDSATYHDWPIERVLSERDCIVSLDSAGTCKNWDLERFTPITSWSIGSATWPRGGQALEPDAALCSHSTSADASSSVLIATLFPCDPGRQLALWDIRLSSVRRPALNWSQMLNSGKSMDLPRSVAWLSPNLLAVGTFQGQLHVIDIRRASSPPTASVSGQNGDFVASLNTGSWFGPVKQPSSHGTNQIVQILLDASTSSTRLMGLVGAHGSLSVCEIKPTSSTDILPSRPLYHANASTASGMSPSTAIGLRRAGGLFLPQPKQSDASGTEPCVHWQAITYSGLPELNSDRDVGPLVHSGLPQVHSGPWSGPWAGKHRPTCPLAKVNNDTNPRPYYIRACSDPVWSAVDASSDGSRDAQSGVPRTLQTVN